MLVWTSGLQVQYYGEGWRMEWPLLSSVGRTDTWCYAPSDVEY